MKIERGGVYVADLNPPRGTEPGKQRPVVVVQTDLLNVHHPSTLVCPLTSHVRTETRYLRIHLKHGEAGLTKKSDIMVDQLRAIDNRRLVKRLGSLPSAAMIQLTENLKIILDL